MTALATARLVLRAGTPDDAEALHALWSDAEAMRWWSHGPHADLEQSRAKMASMLAAQGWRLWVATRAGGDGRAIGTVSVHAHRPGVAEIGYGFARAHWGEGLAREAVAGVVDLLFAEGHRRVMADTDPDNTGSNRLLEALGFACEGRLRAEWETHLGVRDALIWGLLRDEWRRADCSPSADGRF